MRRITAVSRISATSVRRPGQVGPPTIAWPHAVRAVGGDARCRRRRPIRPPPAQFQHGLARLCHRHSPFIRTISEPPPSSKACVNATESERRRTVPCGRATPETAVHLAGCHTRRPRSRDYDAPPARYAMTAESDSSATACRAAWRPSSNLPRTAYSSPRYACEIASDGFNASAAR